MFNRKGKISACLQAAEGATFISLKVQERAEGGARSKEGGYIGIQQAGGRALLEQSGCVDRSDGCLWVSVEVE